MSTERPSRVGPRVKGALDELERLIRSRYPEATFEVARGEDDPESVHLVATVDVEDTDEVLDLVIDRLLELQVEERLSAHVIPLRPLRRVLQELRPVRRRARASAEL